jgi:PncC family amidohydrolase
MRKLIDDLSNEILQHAKAAGFTVATAESCTAGRLAAALAKGEGAAQHFTGGFVTYTKHAKTRMLGVPSEMISKQTAVSSDVALAMAHGAVARAKASLAVAITGVTGPDPDEDGNPVGLVYCAVARSEGNARHVRQVLGSQELGKGEPEVLIEKACLAALQLLRDFGFS